MKYLDVLFLLFISYSILGYFIEVFSIFRATSEVNFNRGFLIGPYLPVFGFGSIILVVLLDKYKDDYFILLIAGFVLCGILEYFTSYIMEKIFGLRWWDYSDKKYNVDGRICLENLFLFSIMGVVIVKLINPIFLKFISSINYNLLVILTLLIFLIFIIDVIVSIFVAFSVKNILLNNSFKIRDHTKEIKSEVRKKIEELSLLNRRTINAFPLLKRKFKNKNRKRLHIRNIK